MSMNYDNSNVVVQGLGSNITMVVIYERTTIVGHGIQLYFLGKNYSHVEYVKRPPK